MQSIVKPKAFVVEIFVNRFFADNVKFFFVGAVER